MYESIQQLLTSAYYKPRLDNVLDVTSAFLIDPNKEAYYQAQGMMVDKQVLGQFEIFDKNAPYVEVDSFDALKFKIKRNSTVGSLTAKGGEVPSTSAGELIAVQGDMAKITLCHIFDEETMEMQVKLKDSKYIPDAFIDLLFGSVNDLQTKVFKLGNVLCAMVWATGKIRFSDPRTNMMLSIDYDTYPELYPEPLTGNSTWDNHDTANGIDNLIEHSRAFYRINGYYPAKYVMGEVAMNHLLRQESTANYARSLGLISSNATSNLPSRVSMKILDRMSEDIMELPKLEQWDARYELEVAPGKAMSFPYNPSHTVTIVEPNSVERLWGLTMESAMGKRIGFGARRSANLKPKGGIFVFSDEMLRLSPPQCRSIAAGRNLPWVDDTRRLGAMKVLAA